MNFVDTAWIEVQSGDGGAGHISFRREKFVAKGGPDGGDGGRGGSVYIEGDSQLGTLLDFTYRRHYRADHGERGGKNRCTGKSADDIVIRVPCGTVVRNRETGEQICDIEHHGERVLVAAGGRGGRGNQWFATPTNQVPRYAEPGTPGETKVLELELKLLADVGLVGYPNVGKSTLISVISAAKPKIADYHFTTLVPNLGLVRVGDYKSFTVADIPGLIEGASEGKGLGHQFLRHVERTSVLVFLIDALSEHPEEDYRVLKAELRRFDPEMANKESIVVLSRIDAITPDQRHALEHGDLVRRHRARFISAVAREGIDELVREMWAIVERARLQARANV
jgi:GTP-binding protein